MKNDQAIFEMLQDALYTCEGEKEAFTLQGLADYCQCSRRRVERILEDRLADLGFVVVSGSAGYWRPVSAEEINHYQASLQSRLRKLAIRKRTVRHLAIKSGFVRTGKTFQNPPALQGELFTTANGANL